MKDYGLWSLVENGKCPIVCDAKLKTAAEKLAPKAFVTICNFHNMGCLLKNTLEKNLLYYDKESPKKIKVSSALKNLTLKFDFEETE